MILSSIRETIRCLQSENFYYILQAVKAFFVSWKVQKELFTTSLPLPPYSPDMNPIEKCWGWMKRIIRRERKNQESMRETVDFVIANLS